ASEVDLRLHTVFAAADAKNAIVRSFLHINAEDLKFIRSDDGNYRANFELVAMSFGDNGMPSEQFMRAFAVTLPEAIYQKSLASEVDLRLHTVFAAADAKNAIVRSFLHINAEDLKFIRSDDGNYRANFELVAMSFGDNGMPSEQFMRAFAVTLPEAIYQKSLA